MMTLFLAAVGTLVAGALATFALARRPRAAAAAGAGTAVAGCALGLVPALRMLGGGETAALRAAWNVPGGAFAIGIDPLSALFLIPIFGLSGLAAVYGVGYFHGARAQGMFWGFFNLLIAGMAMTVAARNAVLFLMAWEVMAVASFLGVAAGKDAEASRDAAWTYLVATHLGTACLLVFFAWMGNDAGSLDFDRFRPPGAPAAAGGLFLLALAGFGAKAGFWPLHVWLPEAHPAAPSPVSAVLSGAMIKTGIYGLVRALTWLGPPPLWWGWLLVGVGAVSAVLGILFALAQRDLKRLLAYSSVENVGLIALGLGLGLLGTAGGSPALAAAGFAGALLHVVNHALFKGLLFMGAGAVAHAAGTREIDRLGGLLKRMPSTGAAFLLGAAAVSGLPPLNGFAGEFLLLWGGFGAVASLPVSAAIPAAAAVGVLALAGGLAAACFAKAFGIAFLGEPRSEEARGAAEVPAAMRLPMATLAAGCLVIGLFAPFAVRMIAPAVAQASGLAPSDLLPPLEGAARILAPVSAAGALFLALTALLAGLRVRLLAGRPVGEAVTWDCGYAAPTPRMQYTASSFAAPLAGLFRALLRTRAARIAPAGFFPREASLRTETPDACREVLYVPLFRTAGGTLGRLRWLQHGRVQLYVLYIALTLMALLLFSV